MNKTNVKCKSCRQEIFQSNPTWCPYCGGKEFVSGEEAAQKDVETILKTGRVESITMECPYCGGTQVVTSKSEEVMCKKCRNKYRVPKKARDLFQIAASTKRVNGA
jgi:Zn finger protein HypA/HybF involved in hydrogenase expression